jgi:hypothetical protein
MGNRKIIAKKDFILISTLGIEFALIMCLGTFGGLWFDRKLNTFPYLILAGSLIAFILALYVLIMHAKAATRTEVKTENKK